MAAKIKGGALYQVGVASHKRFPRDLTARVIGIALPSLAATKGVDLTDPEAVGQTSIRFWDVLLRHWEKGGTSRFEAEYGIKAEAQVEQDFEIVKMWI